MKLTVAWSVNCLFVIVCVALRCPGELNNDLTLKAKAKDSKSQNVSSRSSEGPRPDQGL